MVKKRLVLVGGGYAHLSVLRALAKKRPPALDIVLITPSAHLNYSCMLPGWMAGHYSQAECQIDLRPLTQAAGVRLILDQVVVMDAARRCVGLTNGQPVEYDLLYLDVNSETDTSWLETLGNKLLPIKPLDNFYATWPQVLAQAKTKKDYRLVVVGAGTAGVEIALAAQHAFTRAAIEGRVELVASDAGLLPGHAKAVQARVQRLARRAGLGLHFLRGVGTEDGVLLADGSFLKADHVIAATGARPPVWLALSRLALNEKGYILVDSQYRSVSHPNVFAAGEVCARPDTAPSRAGGHAAPGGAAAGDNLLAQLHGRSLARYQPKQHSLYLLSCGTRYAVASWGQWSAEGQWVWHWKDWIDRRFIRRFSTTPDQQDIHVVKGT